MSRKKRLLKHPYTQVILAWILSLYIRLVYITSRKSVHIPDEVVPYFKGEKNAIFAFWHGRMMLLPPLRLSNNRRKMRVLISLHRDGLLISQTVRYLGVDTISGSTSKRSRTAVREIVAALEAGDNIGITPDGPRGPLQVAAPGVTAIARFSGKPIIPITFSSSRFKRLKSWDRFMLALPFGRVAFLAGSPIILSSDADEAEEEACHKMFEAAMNELVREADTAVYA